MIVQRRSREQDAGGASRTLLGLLSVATILGCAGPAPPAGRAQLELPPGGRVAIPAPLVLISIEGLRADQIEPYAAAPVAAVLSQLAREGLRVDDLVGVTPPTRYPAHATLVTGTHPNRHGVSSDALIGERGVRRSQRWHASALESEALWQAAQTQGHSVASLGWPSTLGAAIDWLVPDIEPVRRGQSWLGVLDGAATPPLLESLGELLVDRAPWPPAADRDAALVDLACEVVARERPPAVVLLRLAQVAEVAEREGPGTPAEASALAAADAQLGRLIGCLADAERLATSAIVVTGDRAIAPVHSAVAPNVVLAQAGLLDPGRAPQPSEGEVRSWQAIAQPSESIALVYAKDESAAIDAVAATSSSSAARRHARLPASLTAGSSCTERRARPDAPGSASRLTPATCSRSEVDGIRLAA